MDKIDFEKINDPQAIQDMIFAEMSADRKLELASKLTLLCLELNSHNELSKPTPNGHNRSQKSINKTVGNSR